MATLFPRAFPRLSLSLSATCRTSEPALSMFKRAYHHLPRASQRVPPAGSMVASQVSRVQQQAGSEWGRKMMSVGVGAGVAWLGYQTVSADAGRAGFGVAECESLATGPPSNRTPVSPQPQSILSVYELSFGAVCGICTGVFLKKGARALAFLLGGVFVLLQYLNSKSIVSINWSKLSGKYDSAFGTSTESGVRAPTVGGLYQWFVDFLTANFQQRASFLAGVALGIRVG